MLSVVVPALYLPHARIDNSIEVWLQSSSTEYHAYRDFLRRFGNDEFVVIAAEMDDPLSDASLALQCELADRLRGIENVERVFDLPSMCRAIWSGKTGWRAEARDSGMLRNLLLGEDGKTAGVIAWLENTQGPTARRATVKEIRNVAAGFAERGFKAHLAGTPVMNAALDRTSERASATFLPLAILISIVVLIVMLKSLAGVLATMCSVGVAVTWTVGAIVMSDRSLNMVSVVLPSLLFVLALSNAIHLASRFSANLAVLGDRSVAARTTLRELFQPVALSSLTTGVGFGSLMLSEMPPVAEVGFFAAVGMAFAFVCNIIIVPGLLSLFRGARASERPVPQSQWIGRTGQAMASRPGLVLPVSVCLLSLFVAAATQVRAESNVLKFFPEDSPIRRDYAFVGNRLTGFYTLEVDVGTESANEANTLEAIRAFSAAVEKRPEVARVDQFGEMLPLLQQTMPSSVASIDGWLQMTRGLGAFAEFAQRYRHEEDGRVHLRVSVLVRAMASSEFYSLLEFVREKAQETLPQSAKWKTTGVVPLLVDVQQSLVRTQVSSFAFAALVVLGMIALLFRSVWAMVAALLPNLLPIFGAFAMMAVGGIPLDAATVMIAGVAIGIAANDTIHFLARYRIETAEGLAPVDAAGAALQKIGRAMVSTSLVAAGGFGILWFAEFRPIALFGLLTGVTMLTALAGDLLVLPACVSAFRLWEKA